MYTYNVYINDILTYSLTEPIKIKKGEKIAQLIISNKKTET